MNIYEWLKNRVEELGAKDTAVELGVKTADLKGWISAQDGIPEHIARGILALEDKSKPKRRKIPKFTFVDLFAGIGGIRLGFEAAGGMCVFSSEWDEYAQKTYRSNFLDGHEIAGDITKISAQEIPDHDVLVGGFPCQPFSVAGVSKKNSLGRPHGFACDTQGTLFFDVARIIEAKRPKAFLLENVKNLVSHDKGNTFKIIIKTLREELGYHVSWRVIDGQHFVPQHRERIIIVGFREKVPFDINEVSLPDLSSKNAPKLRSILEPQKPAPHDFLRFTDKNSRVHDKYVLTQKLWEYLQNYAEKHRSKGNGFGFSLVGSNDIARTLSARYYKDGSEILIKDEKKPRPRRLTPRECARLMGFPDDFRIVVSDMRAYKQFGNSVVVPLITCVAQAMAPHIECSHKTLSRKKSKAPLQDTLF